MTTRSEHHWSNRHRRVESPSTAAGPRGIALRHYPNLAKRPTQPQCQSTSLAGSKRKLEFEYDWQGRRIKKVTHSAWNGSSYATVVTTKFIYDGWNLLAELDSSNNVVRSYLLGTDLSRTMQGAGGVGGRADGEGFADLLNGLPAGQGRCGLMELLDDLFGTVSCSFHEHQAGGFAARGLSYQMAQFMGSTPGWQCR